MDGIYSITANFEADTPPDECTLTFDVIGTGSVTEPASSPQTVTCGDPIDLLAVETDDCWEFDGWTADTPAGLAAIDDADDPDTFITMDDDYSIHANFVQKTYDLNVGVIGTGSVTEPASSPVEDVLCGDTVDLLAVETDDCWEFDGWTADTPAGLAAIDDADDPDTFITMEDDYSIYANFVQKTYDLNVDVDGVGGTVTEPATSPVEDVPCGDTVDLLADPDPTYLFDCWSADTPAALAAIDDPDNADTFITMNGNYSIHANFIPEGIEYCQLTVDVIGTGSVTEPASSPESVPCGDTIDLLAVETDDCWEFDGWTADTPAGLAAIDDADDPDTFITMDDDYSIYANFVLKQVYLTTDSTAGGYVSDPGDGDEFGPYDCGEVIDIVATAVGCYNFVEWTGDTADIADTEDPTTTITMNDDYEITAVFEIAEALEDIEIPFDVGWNTFSTPISLHACVNTWGEFIAANELGINMIYAYDGAAGNWVGVDGEDVIQPLHGYYVEILEGGEGVAHIIPNSQKTSLPTRELVRGVHLIGVAPASLESIDVVSALTTIYMAANGYEGYTLVVSPYINSPNDWEYARDGGDPPMMDIGRAYWLVMENDDDYVGSTTTPLEP